MTSSPPEGLRFSHAYIQRGEPTSDSARMRRRLAATIHGVADLGDSFGSFLIRELGIDVPYGSYSYDWAKFFGTAHLRDVLDTITIAYRYLDEKRSRGMKDLGAGNKLVSETARILREENVSYRVDQSGGVHFSVDEEFERARIASVAALQNAKYANVLNSFEQAYSNLSAIPCDGKNAIRSIFAATEGLFRLMFASAPRLTASEIEKNLVPLVQRQFAADGVASGATAKFVSGFKAWVDGAHFYRHEPGQQEIAQPPLGLAVSFVSLGASYLRWLAEIDSTAAP